jgi:hypothetical protein
LAGQGATLGLTQVLEAMFTGFEAVAIDDFDPIALEPRDALTAHVLDEGGKFASAVADQFS